MSRIVHFAQKGGPEVLNFQDIEVPAPGRDEVRIQVKAIGINRAEAMWRIDDYIEPVVYPARLGYEAAGVVDAVGADVKSIAVGDAVNTIPAFSMNQYGMYGEVVLAPSYAVVKHPPSLSFEQGASIWMMFITAYGALIEDAKVSKGDVVLITAASSSVGLAAIQLANLAGATPVALTRTGAKRQQLLDAGAKHVIATEEEDLVASVMKITDGKGARVIFDAVGGPIFPKLIASLAVQGTIYVYGALSNEVTPLPLLAIIAKAPVIKGHSISLTNGDPVRREAAVKYILEGIETGALKPIIDKVFPFDDIVAVHQYLETNVQFGKIVVSV